MGGTRTTVRNLQIVRVDETRNLLFVKGGIPGARDGYVLISK
jgi:large subunit ribosomal protein L3